MSHYKKLINVNGNLYPAEEIHDKCHRAKPTDVTIVDEVDYHNADIEHLVEPVYPTGHVFRVRQTYYILSYTTHGAAVISLTDGNRFTDDLVQLSEMGKTNYTGSVFYATKAQVDQMFGHKNWDYVGDIKVFADKFGAK